MDPISSKTALAAAGAAGGEPLYVDDVFSTYIYEGTGSTLSIDNGIDLAGEGGLVWFKNRGAAWEPILFDTERGVQKYLQSNSSAGQVDRIASGDNDTLSSFNNNGFTVETLGTVNSNGGDYVSWTFRKAPGFFDVVTYTGTGSARTVAHNLGSVPGMMIIKNLDNSSPWWAVYHHSLGDQVLYLNETTAASSAGAMWDNTAPTSSVFTVGTPSNVNTSGENYVAYLFAHDDQSFGTDGDESIIKCGSYTGNGGPNNMTTENTNAPNIDLGFEPQFVMIKNASTSSDWWMFDTMRGFIGIFDGPQQYLRANSSTNEATFQYYAYLKITNQGFKITGGAGAYFNESGNEYVYMAIRRPHKPPEAGTEVFHAYYGTPASGSTITTGFPLDMQIAKEASSANGHKLLTRQLGLNTWDTSANYTYSLQPAGTAEAQIGNLTRSVGNTGFGMPTAYANNLMIFHSFKRTPGFFDVATYTGTAAIRTVAHNLEAVPELIIVKKTSAAADWPVYSAAAGPNSKAFLNQNAAFTVTSNVYWGSTTPTSSVFTVGANTLTNGGGANFVAYLFATLPGISKVGSYSGTGSDINVDCGFTAGARFVLIKRTDSIGDWYVFDTARGIVSGNDPRFLLNANAAEVTSTDYIDPLNAGFTVTSSATAALNASGGTYLFLAIA